MSSIPDMATMSVPSANILANLCSRLSRPTAPDPIHASLFCCCSSGFTCSSILPSVSGRMSHMGCVIRAASNHRPYIRSRLFSSEIGGRSPASLKTTPFEPERNISVIIVACLLTSRWYSSHHSFCPRHFSSASYSITTCTATTWIRLMRPVVRLLADPRFRTLSSALRAFSSVRFMWALKCSPVLRLIPSYLVDPLLKPRVCPLTVVLASAILRLR